jgi:hypothetical protein
MRDVKKDTQEIKIDTQEIKSDVILIKGDTAEILAEIARLQEKLPEEATQPHSSGFMLQRYLEEMTSYAATVCDSEPAILSPDRNSERSVEVQNLIDTELDDSPRVDVPDHQAKTERNTAIFSTCFGDASGYPEPLCPSGEDSQPLTNLSPPATESQELGRPMSLRLSLYRQSSRRRSKKISAPTKRGKLSNSPTLEDTVNEPEKEGQQSKKAISGSVDSSSSLRIHELKQLEQSDAPRPAELEKNSAGGLSEGAPGADRDSTEDEEVVGTKKQTTTPHSPSRAEDKLRQTLPPANDQALVSTQTNPRVPPLGIFGDGYWVSNLAAFSARTDTSQHDYQALLSRWESIGFLPKPTDWEINTVRCSALTSGISQRTAPGWGLRQQSLHHARRTDVLIVLEMAAYEYPETLMRKLVSIRNAIDDLRSVGHSSWANVVVLLIDEQGAGSSRCKDVLLSIGVGVELSGAAESDQGASLQTREQVIAHGRRWGIGKIHPCFINGQRVAYRVFEVSNRLSILFTYLSLLGR